MASRAITPNVLVTSIFADEFERGSTYANWRPHGSGDWLLIYTAAGGGEIGLRNGTVRTRTGDLLLYEPGAVQEYGTAPEARRWRLCWAHFLPRPAWREWLSWPEIGPHLRLVHLPAAWRGPCREALGRMIRACRRSGPIQTELALSALEEAVLCGRAAQGEGEDLEADPRITRAVTLLNDGFKEPFHLPALARECGLSVSRFSHLFRRQLGKTPGQFIEEQRVSHATHLLRRTSLTIGEISAECGFADPFYFANRFRRNRGISPSQFREKAQEPDALSPRPLGRK
jgi:AraC family transcriptional regulator of arabinose operon